MVGARRVVPSHRMVDVKNTNRDDSVVEASGIDAAVAAMGSLSTADGGPPATMNMKAAYAAFEEEELPTLREECPGLKLSQYKDMLSKKWKKHPTNPANIKAAMAEQQK